MIRVGRFPELQKLLRCEILVYITQYSPHGKIVAERPEDPDAEKSRQRDRLCRLRILFDLLALLLPKPEGKPFRHKTQAEEGKQRDAAKRCGQLRRAVAAGAEPQDEQQPQGGEAEGRYDGLRLWIQFFFHALSKQKIGGANAPPILCKLIAR